MWAEKKFVVEIDEKYVDQKSHQMLIVTYIIGKAHDKKKSFLYTKNCRTFLAKKTLFSCGGKKKVCNQQKL